MMMMIQSYRLNMRLRKKGKVSTPAATEKGRAALEKKSCLWKCITWNEKFQFSISLTYRLTGVIIGKIAQLDWYGCNGTFSCIIGKE